jgi:excisionase family DNA binding protein
MTQRYASVREVALYLGVTETAVRQKVKRGSIPFIRDGRSIRFDLTDVDRYMTAHKVRRGKAAE